MPVFDRDTARIKMVALTKPGKPNITWYSLDKYTNKSKADKDIITGMMHRLKEQPSIADVQVVQFYDNKTKELLEEYRA